MFLTSTTKITSKKNFGRNPHRRTVSSVCASSTKVALWAAAIAGLLIFSIWTLAAPSTTSRPIASMGDSAMSAPLNANGAENNNVFRTAELLADAVPDNVLKLRQLVQISEKRVDSIGVSVFIREALPPQGNYAKGDILMLHGQAFTSANWLEHQTLQTFAAAGFRVVAVDLPGYGKTGGSSLIAEQKPRFVWDLIQNLGLRRPVLISPSMSGTFSLPFLMEHPDLLSAYIPVAPVGTNNFAIEDYQKITVPTLIVYGDRDTSLGVYSQAYLRHLPNGRVLKVPKAGHAAYLNQPDVFHTAVLNFLDLVRTYAA